MKCLAALLHFLLLAASEASIYPPAHKTTVDLYYGITCLRKKRWQIRLELVEKDVFRNDRFQTLGPHETSSYKFEGVLTGIAKSDGYEKNFEVMARVLHNCAEDGSIYVFESRVHVVPVEREDYRINLYYKIPLYDLGEKVQNFIEDNK